ncbi:SET and MYND domain-containing protein 4-like protein [Dinothrombium tinctorium]|uniref:Protein-lysine N-methyltransferase SMYD4 n=1 Tax=Dinothrombium tinctorium TaxID=1965070 RepID=A0A3S3S5F6_9ACAR|nr:SET and MYND domain-containing protein 4-like protein [Dinothrombium tinctorium]RWS10632.1 SET and MYND domain-containing protein 4-like protein [Dinothrombium tinctorium]
MEDFDSFDNLYTEEWLKFIEFTSKLVPKILEKLSFEDQVKMKQLFESSKLGREQIDFMLSNEIIDQEVQSHFEQCKSANDENVSRKNANQALEAMEEGKEFASNCDFYEAINYYNKAILLIHSSSPNFLEQILIERAKILEQLSEYEECLIDIEDAIKISSKTNSDLTQYKEKILQKLSESNLKLRKEFGPQKNRLNIRALNENKQLLGASSLVKINYSPDKGRFIQAQADIPKGTILFAEDAYVKWLKPSEYEKFCYFCMKKLSLRFFSCRTCTSVRFCCSHCEEEAWKKYHSIECNYLGMLKNFSYGHVAVQFLLIAGIETAIEIEKHRVDSTEWLNKEFKQDYDTVASLCTFDGDWKYPYNFTICFAVLHVLRLLETMNLSKREEKEYNNIAYILIRLIKQINLDSFSILNSKFRHLQALNVTSQEAKNEGIGTAVYTSAALLSHSCDPNCMKIHSGSMLIVTSTRKINAGEAVTISYVPHYKRKSFKDRQQFLYENYTFHCRCNACANGWENIGYAFKCPECGGPLILNSDKTNYCIECSAENIISYDNIAKLYQESELCLREGKKLFGENKIDESKELLFKANQILASFYSPNNLIEIDYMLARCCELQNDYKEALNYAKQIIEKQEYVFGESSLELANTLMLCSLLSEKESNEQREAIAFREKAFNIFKTYSNCDIRMVYAEFAHYLPNMIPFMKSF